jgi:hypothetical protein
MSRFDKILAKCREVGTMLSDVVFIGGVAVYLYSHERVTGVPPEASHDADFMISISDFGILRDLEEVTSTPRLGKHQMLSGGVEFDVYVERHNKLIVPYDAVAANFEDVDGLRVASLEHLLVLKLEALKSRGHSRKGEKDRCDVVQLGLMMGGKVRTRLLDPYLRRDHVASLGQIAGSAVFYELCGGNAHVARKVRDSFAEFVGVVEEM